ncbi:MAG: MaoC family dehydratase N-terminal domain-containing protein [Acidimicrobiia bacterium]|nr:MaoC family dehydratase N-terminal domain-containing protein [Acidimicrobiia bacterium]
MNAPCFEDVAIGDTGPAFTTKPLTRTDFVRYAGASGDFNPMHHDETFAQKAGRPTVFGHGMYTAGVCSRAVAGWVGIENVRSFGCRFVAQVWPDDVLSVTQTVAEKDKIDAGNLVGLDIAVTNQNGEVVMTAKSQVVLPSRA